MNNMNKLLSAIIFAAVPVALSGAVPEGYYSGIDGKSGEALMKAVAATGAGHEAISYGNDTWNAFETTDVRMLDGTKYWFDMYSNVLCSVQSGHDGMNIEHSVANSWWGGVRNDAYKDLYHLNPSNADANNKKSNNPLGEVATASWSNGVSAIGAPVAGQGGGSGTVFEPADQFKGDFARAYFYIFSVYSSMNGASWSEASAWNYDPSNPLLLQDWTVDMLLKWAKEDPVDQREIDRNEQVASMQKNRNPFIDWPELADHIWGNANTVPFDLASQKMSVAVERPAAPLFEGYELVQLDTYSGRWWNESTVVIAPVPGAETEFSLDGGEWMKYQDGIGVAAAANENERVVISARNFWVKDGITLYSPVSTLTLLSKNPDNVDLKNSVWELVRDNSGVRDNGLYILVSVSKGAVMSCLTGKSSSRTWIEVAGEVTPEDGEIIGVPESTGVVRMVEVADGWNLEILDIAEQSKGFVTVANNKMTISDAPSLANISIAGDQALIEFQGFGKIQYNKQSPRFYPYTTNGQEAVSLYSLKDVSTVKPVTVSGEERLLLQNGCIVSTFGRDVRVFTISGCEVENNGLVSGVYIAVSGSKVAKFVVK